MKKTETFHQESKKTLGINIEFGSMNGELALNLRRANCIAIYTDLSHITC